MPTTVVFREFAHETIVLNLETGLYHSLNPTAGEMLKTLDTVGTIDAAVETLTSEYDVDPEQLRDDLVAFSNELARRGLIEILD